MNDIIEVGITADDRDYRFKIEVEYMHDEDHYGDYMDWFPVKTWLLSDTGKREINWSLLNKKYRDKIEERIDEGMEEIMHENRRVANEYRYEMRREY
jgi:hypothetical protein